MVATVKAVQDVRQRDAKIPRVQYLSLPASRWLDLLRDVAAMQMRIAGGVTVRLVDDPMASAGEPSAHPSRPGPIAGSRARLRTRK
jgi:hypothetical protein